MKNFFFISIASVLLASYQSVKNESGTTIDTRESFKKHRAIKAIPIQYRSPLYPALIKVSDNTLYLGDKKTDKILLYTYNTDTGEQIDKRINKGKGPRELIHLQSMQKKQSNPHHFSSGVANI